MKQNFRRLLLCLSVAAAPFMRTQALDWVPVGDAVNADGFATTSGTYENGDYLATNAPDTTYNVNLTTSSAVDADNTVNIYGTLYDGAPNADTPGVQTTGPIACTLKVNGDVELVANDADMTINVQEDTVIEPYFQAPVDGIDEAACAHVYFNVANGKKITVNVDHNLEFRGKSVDADNFRDMIVSFAGRGQVIFKMADGTSVWFNGQNDTSSPLVLDSNGLLVPCEDRATPSTNAAGTKVFVLMDQTATDMEQGKNKVVFQRKMYSADDNNQRVLIGVGPNSVFTYLSTNNTGLTTDDGLGYGAVAFDPTNLARGRMVLFIKGAYAIDSDEFLPGEETENPSWGLLLEKYQFNDGAVVVGGHYVPDFNSDTISGCTLTETTTPGYDFSIPAGIQAVMRVVNNQLYTEDQDITLATNAADRRGLLVVNDVANHGKLMSDPYWDLYTTEGDGYVGTTFAPSNPANAQRNVRKGFVLAVNGQLDIYHNTFMDHIAGFGNQCDPLASCDFADPNFLGDANWLKPRNPSALIVDGLDTALFINGNPYVLDGESAATASLFEAANPYTQASPVKAQVLARGNGTLYVKSCASSDWGYIRNFWTSSAAPLTLTTLDYTTIFALGGGTYDGIQLDPTSNEDVIQSGEGNHVLDAEGALDFTSLSNQVTPIVGTDDVRAYGETVSNAGVLNATSLLRSFTGREVLTGDETVGGSLITRPLATDGTSYDRYNSPTLFFNNFVSFNNSIVRHSDVTKYVDGIPSLSEPSITGGERLWFSQNFWGDDASNKISDPNRFRFPEIQLFNSTLELQESLNASGVRFVVKDVVNNDVPNASSVKFFDHGDQLDTNLTGFGRIFLCGSALNNFCDGASNVVGESCCFNVFKNNTDTDVSLSLANGNQFSSDILAAIALNPGLDIEKERAHHLFMFAQPPHAADGAVANMAIGWGNTASRTYTGELFSDFTGPAGDAAVFPGSFPYPGTEPLVTDEAYFTSMPRSLDALLVTPATVSIDGSIICFGSFDENGNSLPVPLKTDNDSGAVFVKHGGKLTTTRPAGTVRSSIANQSVFSTMIGQRLWNDYTYSGVTRVVKLTGAVDLPQDQVTFDKNMGVQPYNITQAMFAARRNDTAGYVRLGFEDTAFTPSITHPYVDRSGAEEATIGWFYRETPDFAITPSDVEGTGGNIVPVKGKLKSLKKYQTRATESVATPALRPADLLYVGPGDDVKQIKVAGATMSDPFVLDISGDSSRPVNARVREFVSLKSTRDQLADHFIGEGAHAVLFLEFSGRIGLGSKKWNENSVNAWNILGKDYVTICPLGDGTVDLNDDVMVADRQALIGSNTFSDGSVHRLTFTSSDVHEIRIPAGGELDLSSFGQSSSRQEIAFAGKTRLVFEEGSTIRFPDAASVVGGVVLYFNDQAELIFEGANDASTFKPFTESGAPIANSRIKIVGKGQIWLNKEAHVRVNNNVFVGVETDALSTATDVTISIQRQGRMDIGDENVSGGTFQVGNPTSTTGHTIAFTLAMNGPRATFHIDRQGFFGLGAGLLNKFGKPNGTAASSNNPAATAGVADQGDANDALFFPTFNPDTTTANGEWQVKPLSNVTTVTVQIANGIFDHSNIFDGSSSNASLMAIGPAATSFVWKLGNQNVAFVRGGGNLMLVPSSGTFYANIWDYAGTLSTGEAYSVLASGQMLLDRAVTGDMDEVTGATVANFNGGPGKSFTLTSAPAADMFGLLAYKPFNLQGALAGSVKRVCLGQTSFTTSMVYTTQDTTKYPAASFAGAEIRRQASPASLGGGTMAEAVERGALNAIGNAQPSNFTANA